MVTKEQLTSIFHSADKADLAEICEPLNAAMKEFGIDTPARQAMFLAQCAHESGNFAHVEENLYYRAETLLKVFKKYYKTAADAAAHAKKPELIANRVYSSRMGNGDTASGDGYRYRGRGLIQLTGKDNYTRFAESIETPVEEIPDYLGTFDGAVHSACWFWEVNGLNQWADAGDILTLTKRINGGVIGLEDRKKHYAHALHVLGDGGGHAVQESHAPTAGNANMNTVIRRGSRGETVAAVQARLGLNADGDFGPGTEQALKNWQAANGLTADGIAGPATLARLLG